MHKIERTLYARLRDPATRELWDEFLTLISGAPTLFDALVYLNLIGAAPREDDDDYGALMMSPLQGEAGHPVGVLPDRRRSDGSRRRKRRECQH